jgi:hypothetical protein
MSLRYWADDFLRAFVSLRASFRASRKISSLSTEAMFDIL